MKKLYGSYQNRVWEDKQFCETIEVGTGMTEYLYTDREAYEVVKVEDQKHVEVRKYDAVHVGLNMANDWELVSNENNPVYKMTKRGNYWYWTVTITADILDELDKADAEKKFQISLFLAQNEVDTEKLLKKGKITKYHRAHVSFGTANHYYDYEF